ncbi:MAG: glycosyltransferase [Victivallaceae bacterium]|nr:glycosyltransferase [Victivallaceae bacterium]
MNEQHPMMIVEISDFERMPLGGQLSFVRSVMKAFDAPGPVLVGVSTDDSVPVGRWCRRIVSGVEYEYFSLFRTVSGRNRRLFPLRLRGFLALLFWRKRIFDAGHAGLAVLVQAPEVVLALSLNAKRRTCLCMPGLNNFMSISRYGFARIFSSLYERLYYRAISHVRVLLAAASKMDIDDFVRRSGGLLHDGDVAQFPTRYDAGVFRVLDRIACRAGLGVGEDERLVVTVGRLNRWKGWRLMLDAFRIFHAANPHSRFVFIGDGEDRDEIACYAGDIGIESCVSLAGTQEPREVAVWLNAADVFVMGSVAEGWPTALLEACACCVPCVVRDFSGAREMISDGVNGFVIREGGVSEFANGMFLALELDRDAMLRHAARYGVWEIGRLAEDLRPYLEKTAE